MLFLVLESSVEIVLMKLKITFSNLSVVFPRVQKNKKIDQETPKL